MQRHVPGRAGAMLALGKGLVHEPDVLAHGLGCGPEEFLEAIIQEGIHVRGVIPHQPGGYVHRWKLRSVVRKSFHTPAFYAQFVTDRYFVSQAVDDDEGKAGTSQIAPVASVIEFRQNLAPFLEQPLEVALFGSNRIGEAMNSIQRDGGEGTLDSRVRFPLQWRTHVAVVNVERQLGVWIFVFHPSKDLIEEPNITIGYRQFVGEWIEISSVQGSAVRALAESTPVVWPHRDNRPLAGSPQFLHCGNGVGDELGIGHAVLPADSFAIHQTVVFRVFPRFVCARRLVSLVGRSLNAVTTPKHVASASRPLLPFPVRHLEMTGGKRRALLRGLFLYRDCFTLWDDRAEIARHEPATVQLFQ